MQTMPVLQVSTNTGLTTGSNSNESESHNTSSTGSGRRSDNKSTLRNVYPSTFSVGRKYIASKPPVTNKAKTNVAVTLFFIVLYSKNAAKITDFQETGIETTHKTCFCTYRLKYESDEKFIRSATSFRGISFWRSRRAISWVVKRSIQYVAGLPLAFLQTSVR